MVSWKNFVMKLPTSCHSNYNRFGFTLIKNRHFSIVLFILKKNVNIRHNEYEGNESPLKKEEENSINFQVYLSSLQ